MGSRCFGRLSRHLGNGCKVSLAGSAATDSCEVCGYVPFRRFCAAARPPTMHAGIYGATAHAELVRPSML